MVGRAASSLTRRARPVPVGLAAMLVVPLLAAAIGYWIILAAHFSALLGSIYADADIASAQHIGALYPHAPGDTTVVLGYLPWYSTLWFELATRWVPFHRELWEVGPWLGALAAVGLLAWSTARVAGRWAGAVVAVTLLCAGPQLLRILFAWGPLHGGAAVHACVLGAFLVVLVEREGRIGGRAGHVALCALVAAFTAAGAASDKVVYPGGLAPFVLAGLLVAARSPAPARRAIASSVAAVGVLAAAGARLATMAMEDRHVYHGALEIRFTTWGSVGSNVRDAISSLAYLFNGDLTGESPHARSLLAFACAVVVLIAALAMATVTRDGARRITQPSLDHGERVRSAHVVFWLLAFLLSTSAFVFSSEAGGHDGRYLIAAAFALPTLVATHAAARSAVHRAMAVAGACVVVVAGTVGIGADDLGRDPGPPTRAFAKTLEAFARSEGLTYGFAAYWDAAPLSWDLHERIQLYPLEACDAPQRMCINSFHRIDSWYSPRPGTRSFLLVDRVYGPPDPGRRLGSPVRVVDLGRYRIVVYDHDIAPDLGPPVTPPA